MTRNRLIVLAVLCLAVVLWRAGTFDKQLAGAGLNAHPCGVTMLTGTVCGRQYELLHAAQQGSQAREASERQATSKVEEYAATAGAEARHRGEFGSSVEEAEAQARAEAEAAAAR